MTVLLDYGVGNLRSVQQAFAALNHPVAIRSNLAESESGEIDRLIIPGVGAFGAAMEKIRPLAAEILRFADSGRPLLGICLGQQLLFDSSEEHGHSEGLGLIPGAVRYLPLQPGLKVPHMGWSSLTYCRHNGFGEGGVDGEQVYFVHSLYCDCADATDVVASADYGFLFPAMVQRKNIWGTQFHPEKSGPVGLRMLSEFLKC